MQISNKQLEQVLFVLSPNLISLTGHYLFIYMYAAHKTDWGKAVQQSSSETHKILQTCI